MRQFISSRRSPARWLFLAAFGALLGCNPPVPVEMLQISPNSATMKVGESVQFVITATYANSLTEDVTNSVTWAVSSKSIVTLDSKSAKATAVAAGTATVTATFNGTTATCLITVPGAATDMTSSGTPTPTPTPTPPSLTSIAVMPTSLSLNVGDTAPLKAVGTYSDGTTSDLTSTVRWATDDRTVAKVDAAGTVTAVGAGNTTITASVHAISSAVSVTVMSVVEPTPMLTGISVSPHAPPSLQIGAMEPFEVTALFNDGSTMPVPGSSVVWSSSNPAVATVNDGGLATGVAAGTTTITATYQMLSDSAQLTVLPPPAPTLTAISLSPAPIMVTVGSTMTLQAIGTYSDGSMAMLTSGLTWHSATPAIASVDNSGVVTGKIAGSTTITASQGMITSAADNVTVNPTMTSNCHVVINEVQPGVLGDADNEFIELYNPCSSTVSLAAWKLVYQSSTGNQTIIKTMMSGDSISAQGYLVLGYTGSSGRFTGHADLTYSSVALSGKANADVSIGLVDPNGNVVDGLGYGGATGGFVEGTAAMYAGDTLPPTSIARKMDGVDTGDNSVDFGETILPTPGAANQIAP